MKYTSMSAPYFAKLHKRATIVTLLGSILFYLIVGGYVGIFITRQAYVAIPGVIVLVILLWIVRVYAVRAERTKERNVFLDYGEFKDLSLSPRNGFHFETDTHYRMTLIKEINQPDGHPDYFYLIEKVDTGDHYAIKTFRPLPHESFRCVYSENTLHFVASDVVVN